MRVSQFSIKDNTWQYPQGFFNGFMPTSLRHPVVQLQTALSDRPPYAGCWITFSPRLPAHSWKNSRPLPAACQKSARPIILRRRTRSRGLRPQNREHLSRQVSSSRRKFAQVPGAQLQRKNRQKSKHNPHQRRKCCRSRPPLSPGAGAFAKSANRIPSRPQTPTRMGKSQGLL